MTLLDPTNYLLRLFQEHGIACIVERDWVLPNSELPAIRALWSPAEPMGRLDIQILIADKLIMNESFAGFGQGEAGLHDALRSFTTNVFHILLAALWGQNDPAQVVTENWEVQGKRYIAYIGDFGTRNTAGVTPHIPHDLLAKIETAVRGESLNADIHWFRLFFGNFAGNYTFEALKDNEIWDAGISCLQAAPWQQSDGYYSVRHFAVLRASQQVVDALPIQAS